MTVKRVFKGGLLAILLTGCGIASPAISPSPPAAPSSVAPASPASAKPPASPAAQASAASTAGGANLVKLKAVFSSPDSSFLAVWLAKEAGIFEKNGLDVDVSLITGGSTPVAALIGGDVQFVNGGGGESVNSAIQGSKLFILATLVPKYTFIIEGSRDVKTFADLKGKQIGVGAVGGGFDTAARVAIESQGMDPDKDVKRVNLASASAVTAALLAGQVPAAVVSLPDNFKVEGQGFHPLLDTATIDRFAASSVVSVTQGFLQTRHDVAQKYIDSIVQAIAREKQDKALSVTAMKKYLKSDDATGLAATYDYYARDTVSPREPFARPEQFKDVLAPLIAKDPNVKNFDVKTILDSSFVQSAVDRGLAKG